MVFKDKSSSKATDYRWFNEFKRGRRQKLATLSRQNEPPVDRVDVSELIYADQNEVREKGEKTYSLIYIFDVVSCIRSELNEIASRRTVNSSCPAAPASLGQPCPALLRNSN
ncbi:hypothetical protein EVAR_42755_1 [Eumeta japonica]|uniref:Mos1 transposase HTH domain-containing protein n=1 Tax=Eumeta variegata TaxID=151549 RepID=A0A4C1WN69_EUMVA|nr:hypothetical protein EVAR_42755_1 [Eumeta japonica]